MRALLILLLAAGACSPAVQSAVYIPGGAPTPVASDAAVRIYGQTRPQCAFEEIGWVSGEPRARRNSPDDVLEAMRARAREMGGDAIIGLSSSDRPTGAVSSGADAPIVVTAVSSSNVFRGTVVRFTDRTCVA
jgi:hypothetical protein